MRTWTVPDPVFKTEPLFIVGCSHDELRRYLLKRFQCRVAEYVGLTGQMLTFDCVPYRVVWSMKPDAGVMLHEVFHLVTRICQDRGITIKAHDANGDNGDETAAYLFEFFARAALRRLRR